MLDAFADILANDPGPLGPTDRRCVTPLHGSDAEDVIAALVRTCKRRRGSALCCFGGQRGTGKSTELRRRVTLRNGERSWRAFLVAPARRGGAAGRRPVKPPHTGRK